MPTTPFGDVPSLPWHIFRMPKPVLVVQALGSPEAGGITRGQSTSFMQKKEKNLLALLCLLLFFFSLWTIKQPISYLQIRAD